jgi:hypothetical protein
VDVFRCVAVFVLIAAAAVAGEWGGGVDDFDVEAGAEGFLKNGQPWFYDRGE